MKVTYFLDVMSSWCHWAEPTWTELKQRYAGRAAFEWKIALVDPADFPKSYEQVVWYYQRSGGTCMRAPYRLNPGWWEASRQGHYEAPNRVAEAARDFGHTGDEIRLALTHAAVREGKTIGDIAVAVAVAAAAGRLDAAKLRAAAESASVGARVDASTKEFLAHGLSQRPAFVITDAMGDKAVFSGIVKFAPLMAAMDALLGDEQAYASHAAHYGEPPSFAEPTEGRPAD